MSSFETKGLLFIIQFLIQIKGRFVLMNVTADLFGCITSLCLLQHKPKVTSVEPLAGYRYTPSFRTSAWRFFNAGWALSGAWGETVPRISRTWSGRRFWFFELFLTKGFFFGHSRGVAQSHTVTFRRWGCHTVIDAIQVRYVRLVSNFTTLYCGNRC